MASSGSSRQRDGGSAHPEDGAVNPYQITVPEIGSEVGPHSVQVLIGEGGAANIYKSWHSGLEVTRALKILKKGHNREARDRFLTEAKILADISHPNIVEIHGIGHWGRDVPYLEMEYVDGVPVGKLITASGHLPTAVALSIAFFACEALSYAHTKDYTLYGKVYRGLIHRDVKPENIFVSKAGIVKLMDFGIARPSEISLHTVGDKVMGTLVYLSPEQLNGKSLDHRTDIFSTGTVVYEMLTGQRAFPQKKLSELVRAKTRGEYKPVDSFGIAVPPRVKAIVERALAMDPDSRFATAADFGNELFLALKEITDKPPQHVLSRYMQNPASVPVWKPTRRRGLFKTAALIAGALVLGGALAVALWLLVLGH